MKVWVSYKQNGAGERYDDISGSGEEFPRGFVWDGASNPTVKCCNPLCKSSYDFGGLLANFAQSEQNSMEGYLICNGNESSAKGKRIYRRCANSLRYRLSRVEGTPQSESE